MKWSLLILASLQLLVVEAQYGNYESLLEGVFSEPKIVATTTAAPTRAPANGSTFRRCGLNKFCVPRFSCNEAVNNKGRGIIDIRIKSYTTCEYLEKCCHKNNEIEKPMSPAVQPISPVVQPRPPGDQTRPPGVQPSRTTERNPAVKPPENNPNPGSIPTGNLNQGCGYRNEDGLFFKTKNADHNEAEYSEFPWVVAILRKEPFNLLMYVCGGSIITPFIVLTAAHCVNRQNVNMLTVRAGEWDMQTNSEPLSHQERTVSEIIQHEWFDNVTLDFDVALLILEIPFLLDQNVQPICLPSSSQAFDGSPCFVSGWGKHKFGRDGRYQQILKKIDVPMVPSDDCQNQLRKTRLQQFFKLDESFICAGGERGKDACTGDGGSPLVCRIPGSDNRYFQAGIVSWGIGCGEQDVPGVYANMLYILPWLTENLNKQNAND